LWLICQDVDYPDSGPLAGLNEARRKKLDRIIALCQTHAGHLRYRYPDVAEKVCVSSNGICTDGIEAVENLARAMTPGCNWPSCNCPGNTKDPCGRLERDPKKIVYASSPDRGLLPLLNIFKRAREYEPSLKLSVCYGWDNIDKIVRDHPKSSWADFKRRAIPLLEQPGITWRGRLGQPDLWREMLSAGMWVYCTGFTETSCIQCMEAQACGCMPICSPVWALADNVKHGWIIPGDPGDPLTLARFSDAVRRVAANPVGQENIRREMVPWARKKFDWEVIASQLEEWALQPKEVTCG
jgi:glycosyltransferase involved in cell wall biosynthesis